jgi:hypothetical protein
MQSTSRRASQYRRRTPIDYDGWMPRFVVLRHETPTGYAREAHFDLMLEQNGVLRTWALEKIPAGGQAVLAEQLADHRLTYLDYEGEISGDRGRVSRVEAGLYELTTVSEAEITAQLTGEKLRGMLKLTRDDKNTHLWRVSFGPG